MVKAKFTCNSIEQFPYSKCIHMTAVCGKEGDNADFTKYTPCGNLQITVTEETKAFDYFKPGENYYLYFQSEEEQVQK